MSRLGDERVREIGRATLDLLTEHGFDNLTMDLVASRAHASKATLYRHWPNKEALVSQALASVTDELSEATVPDTGSLRGDLHALIRHGIDKPSPDLGLVTAVIHACRAHPELARVVRENAMRGPVATVDAILRRAVERGEVDGDNPAVPFALVSLVGPKLLRELVDGDDQEERYLLDYVDAVLLPALGVR